MKRQKITGFLATVFLFFILVSHVSVIRAGFVDSVLKDTGGILGIPLRFSMTNPSALKNYIVYYNETSGQIMFYDVKELRVKYTYTLTGKLTASAVYGDYYVAGTDRGEVIVFDAKNLKNIFRWVNAHFGSVTKVEFVDQYRLVVLFGTGKLVIYDMATGEWKVYMPTDLAGMSGSVEEYGALFPVDFEVVKPGVLLVQRPYYNYVELYLFVGMYDANGTWNPLKNYRVWVDLHGLVLSTTTNNDGLAVFGLPEASNWTINVYVECRELEGFAYMYVVDLGSPSEGDKIVWRIIYGVGALAVAPEEVGYIVSVYKVSGVDLVHSKSITLGSGEEVVTMQDIGDGIYLLTYKAGTVLMRRMNYDLETQSYGWQITGVKPVCSTYSNGNILIGYSDGHLFFYRVFAGEIKALSGYVLKATPVYTGVYGNYYVSVDSMGNIYGFYYDADKKTIVPIYRSETMNGLNIMSSIEKVDTTKDYMFMYGNPYSMLVYGLDKALEKSIDVKNYMLYTLVVNVETPDGVLGSATVVLNGTIVDYEKKTDSNGVAVFDYVVAGNYTVHVYSPSILYDNVTTWIYVDGDTNTTIKLPYRKFNVTIRIFDNTTGEPVYIDVPYSIEGENTTITGTYKAGTQGITVELEPGDYQLSVEGITAYKPASVLFSVPDNLTVDLVLERAKFVIGIDIMDKQYNVKTNGTFTVVLRDMFGRVQEQNITGSQVLFRVDYIGTAEVEVIPLNETARIYEPGKARINIVGMGSYKVYLDRHKYNVTLKIIDKQNKGLARNVVLDINGKKHSLKDGSITLELYAGSYTVKVYGNIYKAVTKTLSIYGNETVEIEVSRKYDLLRMSVKDMFGREMTDAPVVIRGLDVAYSITMYTNEEGKIIVPLPYGTYVVEIGDGDIYEKTETQITIPMAEEQAVTVKYTIKGILLSTWIWIVLGIAMLVFMVFMSKYGAKKIREKFATPEW